MVQQSKAAKSQDRTTVGRAWTDEEKDIVWEQACNAKKNGQPLTQAFREVSRILPHRSEAAVGMLYYNVLKKERDENDVVETVAKKQSPRPKRQFSVDPELVQAFQGLPEYIHQVNRRLEELEQKIDEPSARSIAKGLVLLADGYKQAGSSQSQVRELEKEIEDLKIKNQTLTANLEKMKQAYEDALAIYDMFTNMASISQIMSLGDFKQQMKTTLDKWGNVLSVSLEKEEES